MVEVMSKGESKSLIKYEIDDRWAKLSKRVDDYLFSEGFMNRVAGKTKKILPQLISREVELTRRIWKEHLDDIVRKIVFSKPYINRLKEVLGK